MAKRRKYKSSKSSKCPEPLNTLIDIAGAAALGAYTRHKILKDYERGQGEASVKAAMLVHGAGAMRRGSDGLVSLGGVYGINSALKAIEKRECAATQREYSRTEPLNEPIKPHTNNNKYAWRLNCEDGSSYGVNPGDFETRLEYNEALQRAKAAAGALQTISVEEGAANPREIKNEVIDHPPVTAIYRISRLDSGKNQFFVAQNKGFAVGTKVLLHFDAGTVSGVVLSIHSIEASPVSSSELIPAEIEPI